MVSAFYQITMNISETFFFFSSNPVSDIPCLGLGFTNIDNGVVK